MNNELPKDKNPDNILQVLINDINDLETMFHHLGLDVPRQTESRDTENNNLKPTEDIYPGSVESGLQMNLEPEPTQLNLAHADSPLNLAPGDSLVSLRMKKRHILPKFNKMASSFPSNFPAAMVKQILDKEGLSVFRM